MAHFLSVMGGLGSAVIGWIALNFFGKPILILREKRREALEVGERYAYVGLDSFDGRLLYDDGMLSRPDRSESDEAQTSFKALHDTGNSLRALARERSIATHLYCRALNYDLDKAASATFGLAEAARGKHVFDERTRRLMLHVLFVALGATHHLSSDEATAARAEMRKWHDGNRDMTVYSSGMPPRLY
jgi:hypothetical protein